MNEGGGAMKRQTTVRERGAFYERHQAGETYAGIAQAYGVSRECVRYWCRRQRDGGDCQNRYQREQAGLLSSFDPLVRYAILRLKLAHPRWGPKPLRYHLAKRPSVRHLKLPSETAIGRYLHQWSRFRRRPKKQHTERPRPNRPTEVHQQWQIDFKTDIKLKDGSRVSLHTVRDPVGEACLTAVVFPAEKVKQRVERVTSEQVRTVLRRCFARWRTLPDEIQTDGEPVLVASGEDAFPSSFTLWLAGLGISHQVIRSGQPTDNAEVERCHRTLYDYAIVGNEDKDWMSLQAVLDQAVTELTDELPSRAEGCQGRSPLEAHPELLQPRHPFRPEQELAHFDLHRVDAYLATQQWTRKVGKTGQVCIGGHHQYYSVGRAYARREVLIRFDPADRHFVFYDPDQPDDEIGRRPARNLEVEDLTGLATWPDGLLPQQLPLPFLQGVTFQ
jgi:transposase InsO family protein